MFGPLIDFLFGSVFGWWVLLVAVFLCAAPFVGRYRAWAATRRFMRAQGQKFANPQNADARFQIAEIYLQAGRCRQAWPYAYDAVAIAANNPVYEGVPYAYLRALGQALYGVRRYREAAGTFERALKSKSDLGYFDALIGLSKAQLRLKDFDKALEFARHAVAEQESHLEGYFRWAQAASRLDRADEVNAARRQFQNVALGLPRYVRQRRIWWRLAFLLFPIAKRIG